MINALSSILLYYVQILLFIFLLIPGIFFIMMGIWGISSKKEEKQKVKILYYPLFEYLQNDYHNQMVKYYENTKEIDIKSIELNDSKIRDYRKKLLDFTHTKKDNQVLDELWQLNSECHFMMGKLIKKYKIPKATEIAPFRIEDKIKPIRDKIREKIKKTRK